MDTTKKRPGPPRKYTEEQLAYMLALRERGYTRKMIALAIERDLGLSLSMATLSKILGPLPSERKAGNREVRVRLTETERARLIEIAERHDLRNAAGEHAGRGSVNKLIEAIAAGKLAVVD